MWRISKQLNDEDRKASSPISLSVNERTLTGKQAADHQPKEFAQVSNLEVSANKQGSLRQAKQPKKKSQESPEVMTAPITENELKMAIRKLKKHKSPGPDEITSEMLQHLGSTAQKKLLEIFNISWDTGNVPQIWRKANMIPLLKPGKKKNEASSYRPISLTSCVCKTLERIINQRLKWYLETKKILVPEQAGFRQCYSTEDQATYLSQVIEDAFQDKKHVLTTWVDFQKAFDKVWTEGLLTKLQQNGIKMFRCTRSFLHNRRARVTFDGKTSKEVLLKHGVPQ